MKKVDIINIKTNNVFSGKFEDPTEWIEDCIKNGSWGKGERWVRAKYEAYIDDSIDLPPTMETVYPDEVYNDEDVLDTKIEINDLQEEVPYVLLRADYTIEIRDYKPVPNSVSPMQIRLALNRTGMRQLVEDAVAGADQDVKDMWEFATDFKRDYPILLQLAESLNISTDQLDDLFILAGTL